MYYQNPYVFPTQGYQQAVSPMYNQLNNQLQQPQQVQQQNNGIIWVQGVEGAKAYQMPPNSNVILMDNDDSKFYIKSTDAVGMATLKSFRFEEIVNVKQNSPNNAQNANYVTQEEFTKLKNDIGNYINSLFETKKSEVVVNESFN